MPHLIGAVMLGLEPMPPCRRRYWWQRNVRDPFDVLVIALIGSYAHLITFTITTILLSIGA